MINYQEMINHLTDEFPDHHIEVQMWPAGGWISLEGCEECRSKDGDYHTQLWRYGGTTGNLDTAVERLKMRLQS